jgi:hypothetical protein
MTKLRQDIHVPNEADAFVFASAGQRGRGLMPGEADWHAAVAACDILPLLVESEDPANVRVVVGGELSPPEQTEWVGRVVGGLRIPDGRLALCGGAAYVIDKDDWTLEYARIAEVPAGSYRATVYSYASAPNGRLCLDQAGEDEPLGAWFRRTRPGQEMPAWLHNQCVNDPDLDPQDRARWKRASEKRGGRVIDFLLHLEPVDDPAPPSIGDHGFAEAAECRKPELFPLGVPADALDGVDADDEHVEDAPAVAPAGIAPPAVGFEPAPLNGSGVEVPLAKIVRVARLAWMCHPYTQPKLEIAFPRKAVEIEDIDGAVVRREGTKLIVTFDDNGQPSGAQDSIVALGKQLRDVPDGSVISFDAARKGKPQGAHPVGLLRFRGGVAAGVWTIDASFPRLDAAALREALAVAEAMEAPRRFVARDEAEAERIEQRVMHHAPEFFATNPLQRTGAELTVRRDPAAVWQIATRAFWMRYAGVLPLHDLDTHPNGDA